MKLSQGVQECLLALLLWDEEANPRVRLLVKPTQFDPLFRDVAEAACDYYDAQGEVAGDHTVDLFEAIVARDPDLERQFASISDAVERAHESVNSEYILGKAAAFARHQRLKVGIRRAIEAIGPETPEAVDEAAGLLRECLEDSDAAQDPGIFLADTSKSLHFLDLRDQAFPTGIPAIDRRNLGPTPKRLHLFGAPSGTGKSWWLVHLAKHALLARKRVLYVSLELDQDEVIQRLWQCFGAITKRQVDVHVNRFERDEDGRYLGLEEDTLDDRPSMEDDDIEAHLVDRAVRLAKSPGVLVKDFPTGSLTVRELELYLDYVESAEGFIPELLCLDYPDLMKIEGGPGYRHSVGQLYHELRGLAMKRGLAIAVVTQLNREALKTSHVATALHVAEASEKFNTADFVLTMVQTQEEHDLGLARLFQAKGRGDKDRFTVVISQAYAIGQFCMDSIGMVSSYWDDVEDTEFDEEDG